MRRTLGPLFVSALVGCGEAPGSPTPTYREHVQPILEAKCASCHVEGGIAPFTLTGYEDARDRRLAIKGAVLAGSMPPWPVSEDCADYAADRSLDPELREMLVRWADEGAPEGDPDAIPGRLPQPPDYAISRVDLEIGMSADYTASIEPDEYRCFVLDWPETETRYVSGFRAVPGSPEVVHHAIAFVAGPGEVPAIEALDQADPAPGYVCFGGAGAPAAWIGTWTPGTRGTDYPYTTGIRVEPGSKVILQVHYSSHAAGGFVADRTSLELKLEKTVEREAWIQPWADPAWLEGDGMLIPANEPDVVHAFAADPTVDLSAGQPLLLFGAALHMHTHGTRGGMWIERAGGQTECLLDIPRWNFHWQGVYGFKMPRRIDQGDRIHLECHFSNIAPEVSPLGVTVAPHDLRWGEGTADEMCLGGFYLSR